MADRRGLRGIERALMTASVEIVPYHGGAFSVTADAYASANRRNAARFTGTDLYGMAMRPNTPPDAS
jgi:hypothetical protein